MKQSIVGDRPARHTLNPRIQPDLTGRIDQTDRPNNQSSATDQIDKPKIQFSNTHFTGRTGQTDKPNNQSSETDLTGRIDQTDRPNNKSS